MRHPLVPRVSTFLAMLLVSFCFGLRATADIILTELDLLNDRIELFNSGASAIDMNDWWMCNRVNGSPFYSLVSDSTTIDAGLSTATSLNVAPGEILVLDVTINILPDVNGELGLYNVNSFTAASAIEEYILWGADGIRDIVAQDAGLWTDNESINVAALGAGETLQLGAGLAGNAASDYFIGSETLGSVVPEPGTWSLLLLGAGWLGHRGRRKPTSESFGRS